MEDIVLLILDKQVTLKIRERNSNHAVRRLDGKVEYIASLFLLRWSLICLNKWEILEENKRLWTMNLHGGILHPVS